jgi:hypothetical protein
MLTRGVVLQRNVISVSKTLNSKVHSGPQQWFDRLFSTPKGFGKFYPPGSSSSGAGKAGENAAKATKSGPKKSGDGPEMPQMPEFNTGAAVALSLVIAAALTLSTETKNEREISFQTFQSQLLETGQVDKILVSNKTKARYDLLSVILLAFATDNYDSKIPRLILYYPFTVPILCKIDSIYFVDRTEM